MHTVRTLSFIVLALLAVPALALAQTNAPYTSAALGFTATYPYPVKESADPEGGGTAGAVDPQGVMYMVGVIPAHPDADKKRSVKDQLDDGLSGMLARVHGTVASQKDVKLGKDPGREVEIDIQGGHATFRAYLVGSRTYLIGVVHKEGVTPPLAPADFFASFHLTKKK
jgi:hypothetical protein